MNDVSVRPVKCRVKAKTTNVIAPPIHSEELWLPRIPYLGSLRDPLVRHGDFSSSGEKTVAVAYAPAF
jgi:hypothetical protein